ncbi:hypothetical protein ACU8KH_04790 [Lachancea thermotolerans]
MFHADIFLYHIQSSEELHRTKDGLKIDLLREMYRCTAIHSKLARVFEFWKKETQAWVQTEQLSI